MRVPDMIQPYELDRFSREKNILVIDLRDGTEFMKGHIPGAINYSYDEIYSNYEHISREYQLIFYCEKGNKSLVVAGIFKEKGYRVMSLAEGYRGYIRFVNRKANRKRQNNEINNTKQ